LNQKQIHLTAPHVLAARRNGISRVTKSSKILKTITKAIQDKKGENIVSLDLRKIPEAIAEFFIVCEAGSHVQVKAIAERVEDLVKRECGENPYKVEGYQALQWVLIDYVNIVVHVFLAETRRFYRLEEMWSDGVLEELDGVGSLKGSKKHSH
jgi:ribosome-associated protein